MRRRRVSRMSRKIARATASRGASSSTKRSPSGPCSVAPSPRIASVTRKPSRPGTPVTAVGWNWTNSRSARSAPASRASSRPEPQRARRVGGARVQRGAAAGGEDDGARARASSRRRARRRRAPVRLREQRRDARPSRTSMRVVGDDARGERAQEPPAGRAAAGVDDAADASGRPRGRARRGPAASASKRDAELDEVVEARRAPRRTGPRRRCGARGRGRRRACPRGAGRASPRARAPRPARPAPSRTRSRRAAARRRA